MVQRHAPLDICDAISADKLWNLVLMHGHVGGSGLGLSQGAQVHSNKTLIFYEKFSRILMDLVVPKQLKSEFLTIKGEIFINGKKRTYENKAVLMEKKGSR